MPERHSFVEGRTERPDGDSAGSTTHPAHPDLDRAAKRQAVSRQAVLPTIREVLRLEELVSAAPEVITGAEALDRSVRWVHVSETAAVTHLVSGGELILSTGVGWPTDAPALRDFAAHLVDASIAGVVLELGHRFAEPPKAFADAAERLGLPFIVLHREARFVAITEAVHSRIIADQMAALRARDEIHALFTQLSLRGSPADYIVSQVARVLGTPTVLEDLTHRVIAVEAMGDDSRVLHDWEQRSREAHDRAADSAARDAVARPGDWTIVPVEARGMRWGHLIALPGRPHLAGRTNVLEQAAIALALGRLADRGADEWTRTSHERMITALLGRRFTGDASFADRLEASGVPVTGRTLVGLAVRARGSAKGAAAAASAASELGVPAITAAHPSLDAGTSVVVASLPRGARLSDAVLLAFASALAGAADAGSAEVTVAVGADADGIPGLMASVEQATELLVPRDEHKRRGPMIVRVEDRPLLRLLNSFGGDPRLQAHSERMLAPLIEHDLRRGGDLLEVLTAYLAYPGNRTRAATASHLSRSVFYQRIALIEDLLGVSLDDGEVVSALHAAVLARRAR
ncbi:PucR family transcriptional regulator [Humibacter ginsenosidimutans]|uniref:PucR family transcriptional regulator n=1 Tax=Humibacter ginsenosidimutans TaxID=2599293 RepID=UPI001FEE40A7|nr:PucR family transcriptional regulator [Humibacter ginsenosidimutans]